jgi:ribonuclease I
MALWWEHGLCNELHDHEYFRNLEEAKHELKREKHGIQQMHAEDLDAMRANLVDISDTPRSVAARLDAF